MFEQCLMTYEKNYDKNHPVIAATLKDLGEVYLLKNQVKTAENFILKALRTFQQRQHPESYATLEILADIYLRKFTDAIHSGNRQESENLKKQALDYLNQAQQIAETYFPMNSPHVVRIHSKLKELEKLVN